MLGPYPEPIQPHIFLAERYCNGAQNLECEDLINLKGALYHIAGIIAYKSQVGNMITVMLGTDMVAVGNIRNPGINYSLNISDKKLGKRTVAFDEPDDFIISRDPFTRTRSVIRACFNVMTPDENSISATLYPSRNLEHQLLHIQTFQNDYPLSDANIIMLEDC